MSHRLIAAAVVALLVTACGDDGGVTTTTTPATNITTTVAAATTVTPTSGADPSTTVPAEPIAGWTAWAPADPGDDPAPPPCGGCTGGLSPVDRTRGILFVDSDGAVWASSEDGLMRWDPVSGEVVRFDSGDGLLDEAVFAIVRAPDDRLWLATYGGANVWDGTALRSGLTDETGLKGESTWNLWIQSNGTVWVTTNQGYVLSAFDGAGLRHFSDADSLWLGEDIDPVFPPFTQFADMAEAADGTLWFGSNGNGLFSFDGTEWRRWSEEDGLASGSVEGVAITPDGTMWLDVIGGLTRFDGTTFEIVDPEAMGAWQGEYPDELVVGPDGALWVIASTALFRHLDGDWQVWETVDGLEFRGLRTLTIGEDGSVWIADMDGVARFGDMSRGG